MSKIKSVCIFASSSNNIDKKFFNDAEKLGRLLAKNNYNIVYGGSSLGLMGAVTTSAKGEGASITGVMPEKLHNLGINEGPCTEFILTQGMRERKAKMDELSDAVIALAGGFGTLEEMSEMIVQKQLNYNFKPIVLLNTNGYYDYLVKFFNHIYEEKFASIDSKKIYYIANTPEEVIKYINSYEEEKINYLKDKIKINLYINLIW